MRLLLSNLCLENWREYVDFRYKLFHKTSLS